MSEERRTAKRHALWIPIQMEQGPEIQVLAVSRDISVKGALVIAGAQLEPGSRVEMTVSVPGGDDQQVGGVIVRVEPNQEDPDGLWRYRLAIDFDRALPQLEEAFQRLESGRAG